MVGVFVFPTRHRQGKGARSFDLDVVLVNMRKRCMEEAEDVMALNNEVQYQSAPEFCVNYL